jgi:hypothetical protein
LVPGVLAADRVSATEKGSLLIYPKIEIRWNSDGYLIQDTFVTLNNDFNAAVDIQMYFVSETCTYVDNVIELTKNEPAYWSAATGQPKGVSPWTVLGDPYPDPSGSGDMVMRGFVVVWAINMDYAQIRWNHLYGGATLVNYEHACAWEYNAYAFQVVDENVANGDEIGTPGTINLDGTDYDYGFGNLLLDFFATGSLAFSGPAMVWHDTDLTLLIADMDFRQEGDGPKTTKAEFAIWNEDEVGFSGARYCFTKWIQQPLAVFHNHFLVQNLGTDHGRAQIDGVESIECDPLVSEDVVILGVAAKMLWFGGPEEGSLACSGTTLAGAGLEATTIYYDVPDAPPDESADSGLIGIPAGTMRELRR